MRLSWVRPPSVLPLDPRGLGGGVCLWIIQSPWDSASGLTRGSADWLTVSAPPPSAAPRPRWLRPPVVISVYRESRSRWGSISALAPLWGPARAGSGENTWPSCSSPFPSPHRPERSGKGEGVCVGGGVPGPGDPAVTRSRELARTLELYP